MLSPGNDSLPLWTACHSPHHSPLPPRQDRLSTKDRLSATLHALPLSTSCGLSQPCGPCSEAHQMLELRAHVSGHLLQPFQFTHERMKAQKGFLIRPEVMQWFQAELKLVGVFQEGTKFFRYGLATSTCCVLNKVQAGPKSLTKGKTYSPLLCLPGTATCVRGARAKPRSYDAQKEMHRIRA